MVDREGMNVGKFMEGTKSKITESRKRHGSACSAVVRREGGVCVEEEGAMIRSDDLPSCVPDSVKSV